MALVTDINKGKKKCGKCGQGYLSYRTPRGFWVKNFLFWLPLRRYRCSYCNKKSYVYGGQVGTQDTD